MTSFKSAQLIASSHDADKVVFLVDRKELGIQSLKSCKKAWLLRTIVKGDVGTQGY